MSYSIPEPLLAELSEFINGKIGLHFPRHLWPDLERGIAQATPELGCREMVECVRWLLSAPLNKRQVETLASYLTVGETYFFREQNTLRALKEDILPSVISSRRPERRLRIWSAGCCSGEEPYTVAILLTEVLREWENWRITILGTDINPRFLRKAVEGIYSDWSFRETPPWLKEKYFQRVDKRSFHLQPRFKQMVTFAYLNLAQDVFPSLLNNTNAMDIIFCRNVLMYFSEDKKARVIENFYNALVEGGWLIVGATETSPWAFSKFTSINFGGTTVYQKRQRSLTRYETPSEQQNLSRTIEPRDLTLHSSSLAAIQSSGMECSEEQTAFALARALYETGDYNSARDVLLKLIASEPKNAEAIALLSRTYANEGHLDDALRLCDQAVYVSKLDPQLHHLRATILQEQGALENSATTFQRAIYLDPGFVMAHFALANLSLQLGHTPDANRHFANALSLLDRLPQESLLPGSEGITAGRLREIIRATMNVGRVE